MDLLKHKHILLQVASAITEAAKNDLKEFEEVFMVSALTGNGIEKLRVSKHFKFNYHFRSDQMNNVI